MAAIQTHNKNAGLVPKTREGKEVKIFGEEAVYTIHVKGKEVSGAHCYKDHCRPLISPDLKKQTNKNNNKRKGKKKKKKRSTAFYGSLFPLFFFGGFVKPRSLTLDKCLMPLTMP